MIVISRLAYQNHPNVFPRWLMSGY